MSLFDTKNLRTIYQYFISIFMIIITSLLMYIISDVIGYRVVALILLLNVSLLAILFDIFPVILSSLISALIWNFFFIPPKFTFHIGTPEDSLMFLMYFVVALINTVLTFKIRETERKIRDREEKDKSIKLNNSILNSLSHEFRTPISTIICSIDTIKENAYKLSDLNRLELLNEIEEAALKLNRQVENLLNMNRLESGYLLPKFEWCDIDELINNVIKIFVLPNQKGKIHFKNQSPGYLIRIDSGLIENALFNLINNAIQHNPEDTSITIDTFIQNGQVIITITDNGIGFPEDAIEYVFNKFYKVSKSSTGGIGLGLSIAKGFVEAVGGNIKLQNNIDGGATFIIYLPVELSLMKDFQNE